MSIPYVDIHVHHTAPRPGVTALRTHRLGVGEPLPEGPFVTGVHPWDVREVDPSALDFFGTPPSGLVGVGEIGLDFAREGLDRQRQFDWLDRQLALAERSALPVVLHCVHAYNEIQVELKKHRLRAVLFHGFIGPPELAVQLVRQGYHLSFFPRSFRSTRTVEALKSIPAERLFLETDDDPAASIEELYALAAAERRTSVEALKAVVFDNYERVFHG